jgi:hypothetical protein
MGKWVLAQLDPIKLSLIGLLIGYLQKAQTGQKKKKKKKEQGKIILAAQIKKGEKIH